MQFQTFFRYEAAAPVEATINGKREPEDFETEALKQIDVRGPSIVSVATHLDIATQPQCLG